MRIPINVSRAVFNDVYVPYLDLQTPIQIYFGGSSSGKSVFLAQACILDILKGHRNYLVIRNTFNDHRVSTFQELKQIITTWGLDKEFKVNNTDLTITCNNGYQILFKGLDDVQKIKSIRPAKGVVTDIWIEEATETKRDDVKELDKRLRGLMPKGFMKRFKFSFNPINKTHWIFKEYFSGNFADTDRIYKDSGLFILKTTHADNKFLTEQDRIKLEDEKDEYYYQVYTLGNWGVLGHLVFTNWQVADLSEQRKTLAKYRNGLDFGYTNDPTCLVRTAKHHNDLFITEGFYERGLTNDLIAERVIPIIGSENLWCDSAEPKSIKELKNFGVNAYSAIKGPGSINFGIDWLKRWNIYVDKTLQGCINDLSLYQWRVNKDGETLNEPIDKNNHAPDALRYAWSLVLMSEIENTAGKAMTKNRLGVY